MCLWISTARSVTAIEFKPPSTRRRSEAGSVQRRVAITLAGAPIDVSSRGYAKRENVGGFIDVSIAVSACSGLANSGIPR